MSSTKSIKVWSQTDLPFYGESSSKKAFTSVALPEEQPHKASLPSKICLDNDGSHSFHAETTFREAFPSHDNILVDYEEKSESEMDPSKSHIRFLMKDAYYISRPTTVTSPTFKQSDTFYDHSTNRDIYQTPVTTELAKIQRPKVSRNILLGNPQSSKNYISTSQLEFQGAKADPAEIVKAAESYRFNESNQFYSDTTNRTEYVDFPNPQPAQISTSATGRSFEIKGKFYPSTTNSEAYQGKPRTEIIPMPKHLTSQESLNGVLSFNVDQSHIFDTTTNRETFRGLSGEPQVSAKNAIDSLESTELSIKNDLHLKSQSTVTETYTNGWYIPTLQMAVGVDTMDDSFYVMIPEGQHLPVLQKQIFTTVTPDQKSMEIIVRQGSSKKASENKIITSFEIVGIPNGAAGDVKIEVTFFISEINVLHIDAVDLITGKHQHMEIKYANKP